MIISRTPFRVSFVGGGSDLPAYCQRRTGAVLSVTIDRSMYLTLHPYFHRGKTLLRYSRTELVEDISQIQHAIFREALKFMDVSGGIEVSSSADVPSGTGLGSSSSFTVGLLQVLSAFKSRFLSREQLASSASHLEIDVLGEPIGRQDQYAAAFGGLNLIEFKADGRTEVSPIAVPRHTVEALDRCLLMFYTGTRRTTRSVLTEQQEIVARDDDKFRSTSKMVELAYQMRDAIYAGELSVVGELLHQNWKIKRSLTSQISNPDIDSAYEAARAAGAIGGKLLGAGGGGFMLFYVEPEHRQAVRSALSRLTELRFSFFHFGSSIIFHDGSMVETSQGFMS